MQGDSIWLGSEQRMLHPAIRTRWLSTSLRGREQAHGVRVEYNFVCDCDRDVGAHEWRIARMMQPSGATQTLVWEVSLPLNWFIFCAG